MLEMQKSRPRRRGGFAGRVRGLIPSRVRICKPREDGAGGWEWMSRAIPSGGGRVDFPFDRSLSPLRKQGLRRRWDREQYFAEAGGAQNLNHAFMNRKDPPPILTLLYYYILPHLSRSQLLFKFPPCSLSPSSCNGWVLALPPGYTFSPTTLLSLLRL